MLVVPPRTPTLSFPDLGQTVVPLEPVEQPVPRAEAVSSRTVPPVMPDRTVDSTAYVHRKIPKLPREHHHP